jgi:DNA-binding HxlR family transcriptional regulator
MKLKSFDTMNCSLALALEVVGERWTLLILREAFFGRKRFDDFRKNLGIARNILSARLNRLVGEGIFEKRLVGTGRFEYVLTQKGLDLQPVMLAMVHWGDEYAPHAHGKRLIFIEAATGQPIAPMAVRNRDGRVLKPREIRATPGPGLRHSLTEANGSKSTTHD